MQLQDEAHSTKKRETASMVRQPLFFCFDQLTDQSRTRST